MRFYCEKCADEGKQILALEGSKYCASHKDNDTEVFAEDGDGERCINHPNSRSRLSSRLYTLEEIRRDFPNAVIVEDEEYEDEYSVDCD